MDDWHWGFYIGGLTATASIAFVILVIWLIEKHNKR